MNNFMYSFLWGKKKSYFFQVCCLNLFFFLLSFLKKWNMKRLLKLPVHSFSFLLKLTTILNLVFIIPVQVFLLHMRVSFIYMWVIFNFKWIAPHVSATLFSPKKIFFLDLFMFIHVALFHSSKLLNCIPFPYPFFLKGYLDILLLYMIL